MAWQADPRTGFIPIQARLDVGDSLNGFTVAEGSALFACFPGCLPGGYVGETVLEA
jgi:dye decolorizing peroxidase